MKIHIEHVAMLVVKGATNGGEVEVADGATIGSLLEQLEVSPAHRKTITPFVNDKRATQATTLKGGDRVFLALPISGG